MRRFQHFCLTLFIALILFIAVLIPIRSVNADAGPAAAMGFNFHFQNKNITIIDGKMLICSDKDCNSSEQFRGTFNCNSNSCWAYINGPNEDFGEYHRIIITFSDKVRESNIFTMQGFDARYDVLVEADLLTVKEIITLGTLFNPWMFLLFIAGEFVTIPVEMLVAAIYIYILRIRKSFLFWVIIVNLLSLPIVWFVFPQISTDNPLVFFGIAEPFAVIFEAAIMSLAGRKYGLTIKHASILSLIMNLASLSAGLLIFWLILR